MMLIVRKKNDANSSKESVKQTPPSASAGWAVFVGFLVILFIIIGNKKDDEAKRSDTVRETEQSISEDLLIGKWSPDTTADDPIYIEFFYEIGQLHYDYYRMLRGNSSGFNLANETTYFQYNEGKVIINSDEKTCDCLVEGVSQQVVYVSFDLYNLTEGILKNTSNGEFFYKVA